MADMSMMYKYIVKNVGQAQWQDGHLHAEAALRRQRLGHAHPPLALEGARAAFAGDGYAGLSEMGLYAIGGIIKHAPALWPSPPRRRTATSGSCRATKRR
jgi:glutamine synthetase